MLWAASKALSEYTQDCEYTLLPVIADAVGASYKVAIAVAQCALDENYAQADTHKTAKELVDAQCWEPKYLPYRHIDK